MLCHSQRNYAFNLVLQVVQLVLTHKSQLLVTFCHNPSPVILAGPLDAILAEGAQLPRIVKEHLASCEETGSQGKSVVLEEARWQISHPTSA